MAAREIYRFPAAGKRAALVPSALVLQRSNSAVSGGKHTTFLMIFGVAPETWCNVVWTQQTPHFDNFFAESVVLVVSTPLSPQIQTPLFSSQNVVQCGVYTTVHHI